LSRGKLRREIAAFSQRTESSDRRRRSRAQSRRWQAAGDAKLEAEGKADEIEGKVQNAVGGLKDILKSTASTRNSFDERQPASEKRYLPAPQ